MIDQDFKMNILNRISLAVRLKLSRKLDRIEDPEKSLDYEYLKALEVLRDMKRGLYDLAWTREELEYQIRNAKNEVIRLTSQAQDSLRDDDDAYARSLLQQKYRIVSDIERLEVQVIDIADDEARLLRIEQKYQSIVISFQTQKEIAKAQYGALQTRVRIGEALTGVSYESLSPVFSLEEMEDRVDDMRARVSALDELADLGFLDDYHVIANDPLGRELSQLTVDHLAQEELTSMRKRLVN